LEARTVVRLYQSTNDRAIFSVVEAATEPTDAPAGEPVLDGRRERGRRTRESILATAVDIASVEGLEGLTIGLLASELGMSKSGLFAHFGSKEELQLATLAAAREIFIEAVVAPVRRAEPGLPRLLSLIEHKFDYLRGEVFEGGCFFEAVRSEYDSRPSGPVRDTIVSQFIEWERLLADRVRAAQRAGHLDPDVEPEQLAFEIDALTSAANVRYQLRGDATAFDRAEHAVRERLRAASTRQEPAP
jgi:AcrR family transcriptional regulator